MRKASNAVWEYFRKHSAQEWERRDWLLERLRRAVAERNPKESYACALWTNSADSDGCGFCLSCMAEDLKELAGIAAHAPAAEEK